MQDHFNQFARYNAWANGLLFDAVAKLPDEKYRRDVGLFFTSIHGTLNHLLVADQIWMKRLTGTGTAPDRLDAILHKSFAGLQSDGIEMDERIIAYIAGLSSEEFNTGFTYTPVTSPEPVTQRRAQALAHLFNHQTHHRGQVTAALTGLGQAAPAIDLIYFHRHERLSAA